MEVHPAYIGAIWHATHYLLPTEREISRLRGSIGPENPRILAHLALLASLRSERAPPTVVIPQLRYFVLAHEDEIIIASESGDLQES